MEMADSSAYDLIYGCGKCEYSTNDITHLRAHVEFLHDKQPSRYSTQFQNEDHENKKNDFACEKCPYKTKHVSILRRHVNTVHEGIRKFACL